MLIVNCKSNIIRIKMHREILVIYFAFIIFVTLAELAIANNGQEELKFVQMIFRHGDKTPEMSYPNDPYRNESFWPGGWNYITDKGKRRLYNLGIYFREKYSSLLSKEYLQEEIQLLSSDTDRTIISAMAFAAGLYKESSLESNWNDDFNWEPIPVRSLEKNKDRFLDVTEPCPKLDEIQKETLMNSEWAANFIKDNEDIVSIIRNNSGIKDINFFTIGKLVLTLEVEEESGLEMPEWTKRVLDSKAMRGILINTEKEFHHSEDWPLLRSGPLVEKLIFNMEDNIRMENENGGNGKKMTIFSAHDRTLVDLMMALNIYDTDVENAPPYGSTLIFELRRNEKQHFVYVLYKNDSSAQPYELFLPGCGDPCEIEDFKSLASKFIPEDWKESCQLNP